MCVASSASMVLRRVWEFIVGCMNLENSIEDMMEKALTF
jgi:hypothetical protein